MPKPGIIPLRPLRVSELLSGSFALVRAYWRTILPIAATVAVVTQVPTTLIVNAMHRTVTGPSLSSSGDPAADLRKSLDSLLDLIPALGVTELISVIAGTLATAMLILVVSKAVVGRPAPLAEVWQEARPRLLRLFGLTALIALVVGGVLAASFAPALVAHSADASDGAQAGLTMLVLPGSAIALWLAISMTLAAPALMLERQGIGSALGRSFRLVRGSWWRIFGITILVSILGAIVAGMISIPFTLADAVSQGIGADSGTSAASLTLSCIGAIVGTTVTLPILTGTTALLYMDQRIRREALDLDLAAAAGVPGYQTQSDSHGHSRV
ncbi:hypothetical protein ACEZDB_00025 [Streptacidiphilus sp. N1-3]|uniref:DUF7847 domain-containing protein n=1 Tax=Streptacidiphilus alkalitolerans TaxID=3342712 RepID=A0ABV6WSN1_9ACTN